MNERHALHVFSLVSVRWLLAKLKTSGAMSRVACIGKCVQKVAGVCICMACKTLVVVLSCIDRVDARLCADWLVRLRGWGFITRHLRKSVKRTSSIVVCAIVTGNVVFPIGRASTSDGICGIILGQHDTME